MDVHVWIFKVVIKANGEIIDEEKPIYSILHWEITHLIGVTIICEIIPIVDL